MKLRSKYARYNFAGVQFENACATVTDSATIQKIKASPDFGPGRDFWEDFAPPPAAVEEAEKNAAADADDDKGKGKGKGAGGGKGK